MDVVFLLSVLTMVPQCCDVNHLFGFTQLTIGLEENISQLICCWLLHWILFRWWGAWRAECILYLRGWQASVICGSTRTLQHWLHIGSHTGLMSSSGIISYLKSESLFHLFLSLLHPNYPRGFSFIIEIWESGGYEEPNLCSSYKCNLDFSDICEAWSEFNFTLSFGWHQFS